MSVAALDRLRRLVAHGMPVGRGQWLVAGGVVVLLLVWLGLWSWQQKQQQRWEQAQQQWTQLQTLLLSMPAQSPVLADASVMMTVVTQTPMPPVLQGRVSDVRRQGEQLRAQVQVAPAAALFAWLSELERQGVLVTQASLMQAGTGMVSGTLIWGQP